MKRGEEGMGVHFKQHAVSMGIDVHTDIDKIMQYCLLTTVGSVEPSALGSRARLDKSEAYIQNRLMTIDHGARRRHEPEGGNYQEEGTWAVSPMTK